MSRKLDGIPPGYEFPSNVRINVPSWRKTMWRSIKDNHRSPSADNGGCDLRFANPRRTPVRSDRALLRARELILLIPRSRAATRAFPRHNAEDEKAVRAAIPDRTEESLVPSNLPWLNEPFTIETRLYTAPNWIPFHEARVSNVRGCVSPSRSLARNARIISARY